ncbi:response regulator [Gilvimarinus polysaccharolyticus]|uniref:response regulator n=1 Tax=Gilvimarinus polysaccharolyticus TaxID=863921 RepID=UPI0006733E55|nr:response regulator [Gilvimarinus polysaccharolyticus]
MALRILVVDDASFIRDMVKKHLREQLPGVEVFEAPDGNRALAQLKIQTMDLVLSDWEMPNMNGAELLASIRGDERYKSTPFIMISSRGDRSHVIKAVQAGVSDYLSKPFTPDELIAKVTKQLKKIDKLPAPPGSGGADRGGVARMANASVDVLTAGFGAAPKAAPAAVEKAPKSVKNKLKAQLRFDSNQAPVGCIVREISLQAFSALVARDSHVPALFDQVVLDVGNDTEHLQLNAYVHSLQAAESRPESRAVKVVLRFVDTEASKFELLSRLIS